jgi:antitoxin CptB
MKNLERVRWRCRRGLLELDILLGRFVDTHYASLDAAELQVFDELLDMADNPLWDMISGKQEVIPGEHRALFEKIKSV